MTDTELRYEMIAALAARVRGGMGRTEVMKFLYFLQTLKGVPLGYTFSLYAYGAFDAQVLMELDVAERRGFVKNTLCRSQYGYGYQISPGETTTPDQGQWKAHEDALEWVVKEFGTGSAADLEMASTIVFADQEARAAGKTHSSSELATIVRAIKPYLDNNRVMAEITRLRNAGLLIALRDG